MKPLVQWCSLTITLIASLILLIRVVTFDAPLALSKTAMSGNVVELATMDQNNEALFADIVDGRSAPVSSCPIPVRGLTGVESIARSTAISLLPGSSQRLPRFANETTIRIAEGPVALVFSGSGRGPVLTIIDENDGRYERTMTFGEVVDLSPATTVLVPKGAPVNLHARDDPALVFVVTVYSTSYSTFLLDQPAMGATFLQTDIPLAPGEERELRCEELLEA